MMMRSQRSTWNAHHADQPRTSTSLLDPRAITQYGDRSLWDEAKAVFAEWLERGLPGQNAFGVTVDAAGQHCGAPAHARSFSL